jgi:glyoxylase-like metal-dependent hydrolase (beta-lactamase superfamily II)
MRLRRYLLVFVLPAAIAWPSAALAQVDLAGDWQSYPHEDAPHRGAGPELGDYSGLPLNAAGLRKAESWDASILSLRERQCIPHIVTYALRGPGALRLWKTVPDPDTGQPAAYQMIGTYGRPRTIWLDGRPHPSPYARHTWSGFSTGRWEGNALVVTTTHVKMGWLQRNGPPHSDQVTMTEYFIRHDSQMTAVTILDDPIYLDEPFVRTTNFRYNLTGIPNDWGSCGPAVNEVADHGKGYVPHYLPGENPYLASARRSLRLSDDGGSGGAATVYPEYATGGRRAYGAAAAPPATARPATAGAPGEIETLQVARDVFVLASPAGNVTVQRGEQGVLVVDAGSAGMNEGLIAAIRRLSDKPIRFLINTHYHSDHTGGNEAIAKVGVRLRMSGGANAQGGMYTGPAAVAHENVLLAMSAPTGEKAPTPTAAWPTDTFFTDEHEVVFNGEAIQLHHVPKAHTDGDSTVFFRKSDVIAAGDLFLTTGYPVVDASRGGSIGGIIAGLNHLIDLAIPLDWQEGGTVVVPGHGRLADEADVVEYRDMLTIIRERVAAMVGKGMTLAQVKVARPSLDYDGRYGAANGPWTTDMFIEAVYRDVGGK